MSAKILQFARHCAGSKRLKPKTAGSSRKFRSEAQDEKISQYSGGIPPKARQLLTAGGPMPKRLATAVVPPKASTISSTEFSMPQGSSGDLNLSSPQSPVMDFAAIKWPHHGMDSKEIVGQRIDIWLEAVGRTAADVCDELGVGEPKFSQWRNGVHMISLDVAVTLCANFGLTLDWIYRGIPLNLPHELRLKINEVAKRRAARIRA